MMLITGIYVVSTLLLLLSYSSIHIQFHSDIGATTCSTPTLIQEQQKGKYACSISAFTNEFESSESGSFMGYTTKTPIQPNAPRKIKESSSTLATTETPPTVTLTASTTRMADHVFELLRRPTQEEMVGMDDLYLGYERWLPTPPKVQKPSSPKIPKSSPPKVQKPQTVLNAASLAYLGDCIYELYARRHFLFPPLSIEEYNDHVMAVVRCEAQDALLQKLLKDSFLTEEERNVLRWGKNISSAKTRTKKRAGAAVYNRASSLETLVGHLYLTDMKRLEEVMVKLGFSTDSSIQLTSEDANGQAS